MDHPEGLGSATASEVPARPPGSGYNFRPRSRSATAPKNRRLGSLELQGVGSTLDLPAITPPISPTPSGAGNPIHVNIPTHGNAEINTEIVTHDSTTTSSLRYSTREQGRNFSCGLIHRRRERCSSDHRRFLNPLRTRFSAIFCHTPTHNSDNYKTLFNDFFEVYITNMVTLSPNVQTDFNSVQFCTSKSRDQSFFALIGQSPHS